jgi:hypothetical protein
MRKFILIMSCIFAVVADMLFVWWAKSKDHHVMYLLAGIMTVNVICLLLVVISLIIIII